MTDDLVERCARGLYDRHRLAMKDDGLPSHEWETLSQADRHLLIEDARAVIPIVLEAAAEVARTYVGDRIGLKTGAKLEEAILALKPEVHS